MTDVRDIIPKLLERTDQAKINWRPTVSEDTFAAVIGNWSVSISLPPHIGGRTINLRIHDNEGQLLEQLAATPSDALMYPRLRRLHEKAKRNALGIDRQLEGLLAELDKE